MAPAADQSDLIVDVHMAILIAEEQDEPFEHHLKTAIGECGGVFLFALPHPQESGPSVAVFLMEGDPEPELLYADFRQPDNVQLMSDEDAPDAWRAFARAHLQMMVQLGLDDRLTMPLHSTSQ
ncbi:hypothetical protein [Coralliovum pocilloporae]|uniref:hypothetical protein n=1 Tax=Coralliovum pocilloporae TaxID=3066369 RepID=UPI0033070BB3